MGFMENLNVEELAQQLMTVLTTYGLDVVGAIIILIIGNIISKIIPNSLTKMLNKRGVDVTVVNFLGSLTKMTILIITLLLVLAQFGVQTASLIAVLGAAGLAIGLALQGTLSNVAGGVMLLFFRPIRVGDFVEVAGHAGTVKAVNLFTTEMATGDNIQIILPNATVWGSAIKNFSFHDTRRVDFLMGISYNDDINKAMEVLRRLVEADERSLKDPAPVVVVSELGDSSVNITVRVWCKSGDYWGVKFDLTKAFKEEFDKEKISIPYPHVQMVKD
ncbi:mechanosensitive ion channel family protein [Sneathiella sp. P13V-1]|uniref:mechanosensitive ion channel family protein n=1 Tax=Sneathiella sp. P13V-1 TaxID=2697366 RepID=UPI001D1022A1|nr:mechanosensitive ion channel domain-containing protein [Sneathiella sp. P13V-1]